MGEAELKSLAEKGALKIEPPSRAEYDGLIKSAKARLADAQKTNLSPNSRFDLAYNAAHGYALAALRRLGYRPDKNRRIVFLSLAHTLGIEPAGVRVLVKAHEKRNLSEYEGQDDVDERLLAEVIKYALSIEAQIGRVPPPPHPK